MTVERTTCDLCGEPVLKVPHSASGRITVVDVFPVEGGTIVNDFEHGSWMRYVPEPTMRPGYDESPYPRKKKVPYFYRSHTATCVGVIDDKTEKLKAAKEQENEYNNQLSIDNNQGERDGDRGYKAGA